MLEYTIDGIAAFALGCKSSVPAGVVCCRGFERNAAREA